MRFLFIGIAFLKVERCLVVSVNHIFTNAFYDVPWDLICGLVIRWSGVCALTFSSTAEIFKHFKDDFLKDMPGLDGNFWGSSKFDTWMSVKFSTNAQNQPNSSIKVKLHLEILKIFLTIFPNPEMHGNSLSRKPFPTLSLTIYKRTLQVNSIQRLASRSQTIYFSQVNIFHSIYQLLQQKASIRWDFTRWVNPTCTRGALKQFYWFMNEAKWTKTFSSPLLTHFGSVEKAFQWKVHSADGQESL